VTGRPRQERTADERYRAYYQAPQAAAPVARYEQWLQRAENRLSGRCLLEVGAGSGGLVRTALSRGWRVDATELSESGAALLRQTSARVFQGELADARYEPESFDFVACLEVLEHVPNPAEQLRELYRVLRAGGLLLLTTPNFDGVSRRVLGLKWRIVDPEHLGYFNPRTLRRALEAAGFARVEIGSRTLDVLAWQRSRGRPAPRFDAAATARLRDGVDGSRPLRLAKEAINGVLRLTGLGDSLLAWAVR
jgi:2-polyprenyl-3-methyl-5-hydroxy-6-metoxy-1,4-benzoquinol methylase